MNNVVPLVTTPDAPLNAAARTARTAELFALLETAIRTHEYQQSDVFQMIADWSSNGDKVLGHAISSHAAAIMRSIEAQDETSMEFTCTDIIVEMYRRTFFNEETARMFDTHLLLNNPKLMEDFVTDFICRLPAPGHQG